MQEYKFEKIVKTTDGQQKKHYTQMTGDELKVIKRELSKVNINYIRLSEHATNHVTIDQKQLRTIFSAYDIIEFNTLIKGKECHRVLIRSRAKFDIVADKKLVKAQYCVVYDLTTQRVITIYANCVDDYHETINMDRYTLRKNICELLK